jgi:cytochrome P450
MTLAYNNQIHPIDNNLVVIPVAHTAHYNPELYTQPSTFKPERFLDPETPNHRTFSRGARACLGQNLAQDELKIILLMTVRDYDFECAGLEPNQRPRTEFTQLDTVFGDVIFQELGLEAKPRGGMMMRVRRVER